jgi:ADP-ribosylglycohydrolase
MTLRDKALGTLVGSAVGDALGGATEGWTPAQIRERYDGWVTGIVPPFNADWRDARPIAPYHKGDGHITDDTLMTHALVDVYAERRDHLDAYAIASDLVPLLIGEKRWIPELEAEALLLQRIFLAEKWLVARIHYGHVDPREAGVGNIVNCGAAMYVAPVGVVNAADPAGAYAEGIEIAAAHQSSYGREAAGVLAAAVAAAHAEGATPRSVVDDALATAHDGTRAAIAAVAEAAEGLSDWREAIPVLRAAVEPYDTVGEHYRQPAMDARRPSRTKAIEELPVALGMVLVADGDWESAVLGGVNYGRDADSIASMAGSVCGALGGLAAVRSDWATEVAEASRTPLEPAGETIAAVAVDVMARDADRARTVEKRRAGLLGDR